MHRSSPDGSLRVLPLLLLTLFAFAVTSGLQSQTFKNPRRIPTPTDPGSLIVADFNNDGRLDLAYGDITNGQTSFHILLAQGTSGYTEIAPVNLPLKPSTFCRSLDANHDGNQDIVCAAGSNIHASLIMLLGKGDGTFSPPVITALPDSPFLYFYPVLAPPADLNGDGYPDLFVVDDLNQWTYVMLGNDHGGFTVASKISGGLPSIVQDVNGDGHPDILFPAGPSVMLGNGNGTFGAIQTYSAGSNGNKCVFADIDKDGHPDAVCGYIERLGTNGATHLIVLHGNSDGSFSPAPISDKVFGVHDTLYDGQGSFLNPLAVADLNRDGYPDIIGASSNGWIVLLGQPGLAFGVPTQYVVGAPAIYGAFTQQIADMNGDGNLDIITIGTKGIYISYGKPDGTFDTAQSSEVAQVQWHASFADFNGDGIPDVATTGDTSLQLSLGRRDGTFAPYHSIPNSNIDFSSSSSSSNTNILHGDFNGDGKQDLISIGSIGNQPGLYLYFGHGDGTFDPIKSVAGTPTMLQGFSASIVGDLNGDGRDDVLTSYTSATVLGSGPSLNASMSRGDGSFQSVVTAMPVDPLYTSFNAPNSAPALADFNHDGKLDVVFGSLLNVYVMSGRGDGSFDTHVFSQAIPSPPAGFTNLGTGSVAVGDFDGDGNLDIGLVYQLGNTISIGTVAATELFIYFGAGDGTFAPATLISTSNHNYVNFLSSDLEGRGTDDIILRDTIGLSIVHPGQHRSQASVDYYTLGRGTGELVASDMNGDGLRDLLITSTGASAVTVLLSQPAATIPTVTGTLTIAPEPSIIAQPITLTAALSSPAGITATLAGNISFSIDGIAVGMAPLTSNTATLTTSTPLAIGTHQVTATWPGDTTYPAIALTTPHLVVGVPVTLNLASSASASTVGRQITLTASVVNVAGVPAGSPAPTGTITLTDNGTLFATSTITAPGVILTNSLLLATAGTHTIVATYSGDANHPSATAITTVQVTALPTTVTLTSSATPAPYGLSITFTATVTANSALFLSTLYANSTITLAGLPGGPISVPVTLSASNSSAGVAVGIVTYTIATLPPGSYPITASFSGNNSTTASASTSLTQVIRQAISSTALLVTPNPAYTGQTVTFAVTVSSPAGAPTGTVLLFDGGLPLATITLNPGSSTSTGGSAQAFFATALLGVGTHTLSARYSGDTNNLVSFSPNVSETILLSTFTLSLSPATLSLQTGHHATVTLTATSIGGFTDTLRLTTGNLPVYTTLNFTPATLQLAANGTATSTLYLDTDFILGFLSKNDPHSTPQVAPQKLHPALALALGTLSLTPLALLLPLTLRCRSRMRLPTLLAATIACALLYSATGCSGRQPPSTVPGTYNIQITATPTFSQTPITLTLPLTITP